MKSPEERKQSFVDAGVTITDWAQKMGFKREDVYAVLNGRLKGNRGKSHQIAVALGIKPVRITGFPFNDQIKLGQELKEESYKMT